MLQTGINRDYNRKAMPENSDAVKTAPIPTSAPTYTYIPFELKEDVPELALLQKLVEKEKQLDISVREKENQLSLDATSGGLYPQNTSDSGRLLRVYVYNTAHHQPWQDEKTDDKPHWLLRVEGKLLNRDGSEVQGESRPFSSYFQAVAVDFKKFKPRKQDNRPEIVSNGDITMTDGENTTQQLAENANSTNMATNDNDDDDDEDEDAEDDSEIIDAVEWHYDSVAGSEFDGIDVKRPGTQNINCTITIQPRGCTGEEVEYSPELSQILGINVGSVQGAVYGLYKYILNNNLLNNEGKTDDNQHMSSNNSESTKVTLDSALHKLLPKRDITEQAMANTEELKVGLKEVMSLVNDHFQPLPAKKINYTIRTDVETTYGQTVFDIQIGNESPEVKETPLSRFRELAKTTDQEVEDIDEQINMLQLQLNALATKHQFFKETEKNPLAVLKEYALISKNATEVLASDLQFTEDSVRLSDFYKENEALLFENLATYIANSRL